MREFNVTGIEKELRNFFKIQPTEIHGVVFQIFQINQCQENSLKDLKD